ncbi:hypothetical protein HMPREF9318_01644 [Streptococcus urinalis FB127-CNA-2]|uniref:PF11208 family protein n=1 Tax=Streptococcus urinalis 2285-97 TaxID=764291 RepID=G5KF60_9STRE|nr:YjdF family protein [Streptococcus urinalis]EHJ56214.1 hypothetical protein STRUR_2188 [Streptococcus urinalis 2285-97]EKS18145.1 hypothetical protein HMPREF9318_01644 [Streptococcus urinalis FB127-CNA-2]VEF33030.1 Protein of uncharacterised function (DUF2992) [Streptococcus urinalis]
MEMTVYFDGIYWVALIEYDSDNGYKAFRHVFGKEPKDEEIIEFIRNDLGILFEKYDLLMTSTVKINKVTEHRINPKRMQREISKSNHKPIVSTKAQLAMKEIHEQLKCQNKVTKKVRNEKEKNYRYQLKQKKRYQKRKGH